MKLTLIRNATLLLEYAGQRLLIDPYFAAPYTLPSYTGRSKNPLAPLPLPASELIGDVDLVLVSHLHTDHFDQTAQQLLPKSIPILCPPGSDRSIREKGFATVTVLEQTVTWENLTLQRTAGRHGTSAGILDMMGQVSGFLLQANGEPTLYWSGDTVLYPGVEAVIRERHPDVIIVHSGGAVWGNEQELIIMDAAETVRVCQLAPWATVVATHMEALDHCFSSRADLALKARAAGIPTGRLLIPADGASLTL